MQRIPLAAIFTLCSSLWAADKMTPLAVRPGLWEVTTTTTQGADAVLPASLLDKLTPEQRARMEERMEARPSHEPQMTVSKLCVTEDQLQHGIPFRPFRNTCIWIVLSSTSDKVTMRAECVYRKAKTMGTASIEAHGAEEVKGSTQFLSTDGNTTPSLTSTFLAKWIGPVCANR